MRSEGWEGVRGRWGEDTEEEGVRELKNGPCVWSTVKKGVEHTRCGQEGP